MNLFKKKDKPVTVSFENTIKTLYKAKLEKIDFVSLDIDKEMDKDKAERDVSNIINAQHELNKKWKKGF